MSQFSIYLDGERLDDLPVSLTNPATFPGVAKVTLPYEAAAAQTIVLKYYSFGLPALSPAAPAARTSITNFGLACDGIQCTIDPTGNERYLGSVSATSNGLIVSMPAAASNVYIFSPSGGKSSVAVSKERKPFNLGDGAADKYLSSISHSNGKVYGIPFNEKQFLVYDPLTNIAQTVGTSLTGLRKFAGGVEAANGFIYAIPSASSKVFKLSPLTEEVFQLTAGAVLGDALWKWSGGDRKSVV